MWNELGDASIPNSSFQIPNCLSATQRVVHNQQVNHLKTSCERGNANEVALVDGRL